jgi:hypothetical protein
MITNKICKAVSWLNVNCKTILPIVGKDSFGNTSYTHYLFKFSREGKSSAWYLMKMADHLYADSIKRICLY